MAANREVIIEEIEALQAIMMEDVKVHYNESDDPNAVEVAVKPATAQNVEEQHVRVTLLVSLPQGYPDEHPTIHFRNPRGIDEDVLEFIEAESLKKCDEYLGLPVIYELIELVREKLTANNAPSCPCAICLFHFCDNDHFTKTPCFHYFHSNCLGRYILNCEQTAAAEEKENQQPLWMTREKRRLICPVCREPLDELSGRCLFEHPPPLEGDLLKDFNPSSPDVKALQEKMNSLFMLQKSKGGIIDLEEEKNKFLISSAVNIESLEENSEDIVSNVAQNENTQANNQQAIAKSQTSTQSNVKKGAAKGGNQKKKNYTSSNGWWANKNRNRRPTRGYTVASNTPSQNNVSSSAAPKYVESYASTEKTRQNGKQYSNKSHKGPESDPCSNFTGEYSSKAQSEPSRYDNKKSGRSNYKYPKGRGAAKGMPPPGFSKLEQDVKTQAAS